MGNSNEEKRTGSARMDFSSFSYQGKSKGKETTPSRKPRTPIRQFIRQNRKSTPTIDGGDPVVLIPRTPSPYVSKEPELKSSGGSRAVNLFGSDIPSLSLSETNSDEEEPVNDKRKKKKQKMEESDDSDSELSEFSDSDSILSLSEFPDSPPKSRKSKTHRKPQRQTRKARNSFSSFGTPARARPVSSPLDHLAPTTLSVDLPQPYLPSYVQSITPTDYNYNVPATPEYSMQANAGPVHNQYQPKSETEHNSEDLLGNIQQMNEQIKSLYRKQISLVDSFLPEDDHNKELEELINRQQEQIDTLSQQVTNPQSPQETMQSQTETFTELEVEDSHKDEVNLEDSVDVYDKYAEREGIEAGEWLNVQWIIDKAIKENNADSFSSVFSSVLTEGTFSQCMEVMQKGYTFLEVLSLEEFHLAFDFIQDLLAKPNQPQGEISSTICLSF